MTHTHTQAPLSSIGTKAFGLVLVTLLFAGCDGSRDRDKAAGGKDDTVTLKGDDAVVSALVRDEETCLTLAGKMNSLSKGLMGLRLPTSVGAGAAVFGDEVTVTDLGPEPRRDGTSPPASVTAELQSWPVSKASQKVKKVDLWRPLLDAVESFEHARVYVIDGEHPNGDGYRFEANGGFEGLAKMKSGEWRSLNGKMRLGWERPKGTASGADWRITGWKTERMDFIASPRRLFVEALDKALGGPEEAGKLRRSRSVGEALSGGDEGAAASVFCADFGKSKGGFGGGRHRSRWF